MSQIGQYRCTVEMLVIAPQHPAGMSAAGCWIRGGKDCKASLDTMFAEKCLFFKTRKKRHACTSCTFPFCCLELVYIRAVYGGQSPAIQRVVTNKAIICEAVMTGLQSAPWVCLLHTKAGFENVLLLPSACLVLPLSTSNHSTWRLFLFELW